ncbi:UrcA family protein [Parasphingorhabdus sp.]|uniref:UrcA family protein n=1 Tax=Parasphingorhabdus sp. TaxID=2709688 RepID=UPI003BAF7AD1
MKIVTPVALGLTTLCLAPTAAAEPVSTIKVSYDDLDFARPEDKAEFHRRIKTAVRQVCRTRTFHPLVQRATRRKCRDQTSRKIDSSVRLAIAKAGERRHLVQSTKSSRR